VIAERLEFVMRRIANGCHYAVDILFDLGFDVTSDEFE
jgi:hypothetical protein